ncbi:hypothetical protein AQUSIP_22830 [Aquicella siphonis]|uniref:DUF1634 domain-containing protein n=1 Tax=Aquicella siphonis TaxID=254247 RepID=A0A5E4PL46_9COXI|nr:DUF1634 domain-containing protein [Aquicella siphonis]VVC76956.1 hypothetical protein AQUSIP_22830 [Aquicella siphonis]
MQTNKTMEEIMGLILTAGMMIACCMVIIGGSMYLYQNGGNSLQSELFQTENYHTSIAMIWHTALSFSPMGIIELGLLTLVGTQVVRVAMLVWYYGVTHDFWFASISLFILVTLVYSFFWRT